MIGTIVTAVAFLAGFLAIFSVNLVVTDLFLRDRERIRKRMEADVLKRQRERAKNAAAGRSLEELAAEAFAETAQHKTLHARLRELLEQSGTELTVGKLLAICGATGIAVGVVVGVLLRSSILGGLAAGASSLVPLLCVQFARARRLDALRAQLPDALELMSRILRAGQTITQAMHAVANEFRPPIAEEFGLCYEQQNLGLSMDVALRDLARRTGLLEIKIFVLGLLIHRRSGGNLTELLDNLASIVRERFKLRGKIKAMTAEGRFQATALLVLPVIAFLLLVLVNRSYALKLLDHPWMIFISVVSMAFGAVWIRRIVNFDF